MKRNGDMPTTQNDGADEDEGKEEKEENDDGEDDEETVQRWFRTHIVDGSSHITSAGSLELAAENSNKRGGADTMMRFKRFENLSQISASLSAELYESIMMNKAKKKIISQLVEEVLDSL